MAINTNHFNTAVEQWGSETHSSLKQAGKSMGILHRSNSPSSGESLLKMRVKYAYDSAGFIRLVTFGNINRSLIYTSMGAGNGIGGTKGSRWITAKGIRKKTNPKSMGKLGTGNRRPKPFLQMILDSNVGVNKLADIVAEQTGDSIIESVYFK